MSAETKPPAKRLSGLFAGWLFFFVCFALLYLATVQRGVSWQDSGRFQTDALVSAERNIAEYAIGGDLALAHTAYVTLARTSASFFHDSPIVAINAVSSVCMAIAVANVWLICLLTLARGRKLTAAVAATLFGMAHMPWWMATIAEVYATSAMMLSVEFLFLSCALRDWNTERLATIGLSPLEIRGLAYIFLAATTGLHIAVHGFAVLAWPIYATTFIWQVSRHEVSWKILPMAMFAWLLGVLPLASLISARAHVTSLPEAICNLLVGNSYSQEVLSIGQRWRRYFLANMGLFSLNFLNPAWLLAGIGICTARSRLANVLRAIFAFHFVFFIRYLVADQATFAIPTLLLFSLFAADGMARLKLTAKTSVVLLAVSILFPPVAYATTNTVIHQIHPAMITRRSPPPFRDEIRYWIIPWKHDENSAQVFAEEVAETTERDAVIVADFTASNPLNAYFHAHPTSRHDRKIGFTPYDFIGDYGNALTFKTVLNRYHDRPWYVIRPFPGYAPVDLLTYDYEPYGSIYRLKKD